MNWLKWSKTDINTIRIALNQKFRYRKDELAERLSNHLGVDIESVKMKIRELRENERIQRICRHAREKKRNAEKKFKRGCGNGE